MASKKSRKRSGRGIYPRKRKAPPTVDPMEGIIALPLHHDELREMYLHEEYPSVKFSPVELTARLVQMQKERNTVSGVPSKLDPTQNARDRVHTEIMQLIHVFGIDDAIHTPTLAWLLYPRDQSWTSMTKHGYSSRFHSTFGIGPIRRLDHELRKLAKENYIRRVPHAHNVVKLLPRAFVYLADVYGDINDPLTKIVMQRNVLMQIICALMPVEISNVKADPVPPMPRVGAGTYVQYTPTSPATTAPGTGGEVPKSP